MIKRTFSNYQKNPDTGQYMNMGDLVYTVSPSPSAPDVLIFERGAESKTVKVVNHGGGYVYQIRKHNINANGGAAGLYEFLQKEASESGSGFLLTMFNKVFDYMN